MNKNYLDMLNEKFFYFSIFIFVAIAAYLSIDGQFIYGIFGDRDLVRSLQIIEQPLAYSAEMSFSDKGSANLGSTQYYLIHFFMLFSKAPEWIYFCVLLLFFASSFFIYKIINKEVNNSFVALIFSLFYLSFPLSKNVVSELWNPAFVPFFSAVSLYFCYRFFKHEEYNFIYILGSAFFAGISMQMHISAAILFVTIYSLIFLKKSSLRNKFVCFLLSLVGLTVSYASYFLNVDSIDAGTGESLFLYRYLSIVLILSVFIVFSSFVRLLVVRDVGKCLALVSGACLFFIAYVYLSIFNMPTSISDKDYFSYDSKDIPISYKINVDERRLSKIYSDRVNYGNFEFDYIDDMYHSVLLPQVRVYVRQFEGNFEFAIVNEWYNKERISKKIDLLEKSGDYQFFVILSFILWLYVLFRKEINAYQFSLVLSSILVTLVLLLSFVDMFANRYLLTVFIMLLLAFSFIVEQVNFRKAIHYEKSYFLFFSVLILLYSTTEYFCSTNYPYMLEYKDVQAIKLFLDKEGSDLRHAASFKSKDGKLFRMLNAEGTSFYYDEVVKDGTVKRYYDSKNDFCYAIATEDNILTKESIEGFYHRMISDKVDVKDFEKVLTNDRNYIVKYKNNIGKCYTNFDNKYIITEKVNESEYNLISVNHKEISFSLFFHKDSIELISRQLRGIGFDTGERRNNIFRVLKLSLKNSDSGKIYKIDLFKGIDIGVLAINAPIKFSMPEDLSGLKGDFEYEIYLVSLNSYGHAKLSKSIDFDMEVNFDNEFFKEVNLSGRVKIK